MSRFACVAFVLYPHVTTHSLPCKRVLVALFQLIEQATSDKAVSCEAQVRNLGEGLRELSAALTASVEPWSKGVFAETKHVTYAFRSAVPFVVVCVQALISAADLKKRLGDGEASLRLGLQALVDSLKAVGDNAKALQNDVKDGEGLLAGMERESRCIALAVETHTHTPSQLLPGAAKTTSGWEGCARRRLRRCRAGCSSRGVRLSSGMRMCGTHHPARMLQM